MDSQATFQEAIRNGGTAETYALRGKNLDTAKAIARDADSNPVTAMLVQLPGINQAYQVLQDWHQEFSPRVFGEQAVLIKKSKP